jgi:glycosyltransferase involved in cell wall biosynthesis
MGVAFSVIIPTHNRRETLLAAIASALEQTRPPAEIIVVADGCTDGTQDAVRSLGDRRVTLLDLPKAPGYGYGNRNIAADAATGDVVAWLGDDDLYLPDHLARAGELFDRLDLDIVQANACIVHRDDRLEPVGTDWRVPRYRERFLAAVWGIPMTAVSHRAALLAQVGGWDSDMLQGGDMDLWRRMVRAGARTAMLDESTVLHIRAWRRKQPYPERVVQNRHYLELLRDPESLVRLRSEIGLAHQQLAAESEIKIAAAEEHAAKLIQRADELEHRALTLETEVAELRPRAQQLAELQQGGWWRLRTALLPLLGLYWRLRGRPGGRRPSA